MRSRASVLHLAVRAVRLEPVAQLARTGAGPGNGLQPVDRAAVYRALDHAVADALERFMSADERLPAQLGSIAA